MARPCAHRVDRFVLPLRAAIFLACLFVLSGCSLELAREHALYCRMDEQLRLRDTLYFGMSIQGGGVVDDSEWKRFEDDMIANAFPEGFTVIDAHGNWRGADGSTISEPSRIVAIVHADDAKSDAAIRNIVQRYRATFHQEAVLRERTTVCSSL